MPKDRNEQTVYSRNIGYDMKIAIGTAGYANGKNEYIGFATAGSATSSAVWQIYKLEYDSSGRVLSRRYADGTDDFTKIWDSASRTGYNYTDI